MEKKILSLIVLGMLLIGTLTLEFDIQPVKAGGTIYIHGDGSVDPVTAPITNFRNIYYTLTKDANDSIVIERDNIVLDGAGYTIHSGGQQNGIDLSYRSNVTIKNIKITSFGHGISLWYSSNNTISGNNITANYYQGISGYSSNYNIISRNNIANNRGGIYPYGSSNYNTIFGNTITANEDFGIWLDFSSYNDISRNKITANTGYGGIRLRGSSGNSISENDITNNEYGIQLSTSSNNIIYHNNFIDNTQQVLFYESGYANVWDDGYPSGGNYWSHFDDLDLKSGHNQDLPGSDGILDHPYSIDENNMDHYPFQDPKGWLLPGDINNDGIVDIFDVVLAALAFDSRPGDDNWNQAADLNNDDVVDIFDIVLLANNFGKTV